MSPPSTTLPIDFCIITALEEERDAVLSKLPGHRKLDRDGTGAHTYFEAQVQTQRGDRAVYRVIVTCLSGMGPIKGANKASAVVTRWKPRHVLVVGIAGGVEGEVALGDVLVASTIVDYTLGKERDEAPREVRWQGYLADSDLLDAANNFSRGWEDLVSCSRPEAGVPERRIGVIASGGDVIAAESRIARYRADHPKLIGVEMEGSGVAAALHEDITRPRFLMIRSVSDLANGADNARTKAVWRGYACDVAAAYAIGLLRDGPVPASTSQSPKPFQPVPENPPTQPKVDNGLSNKTDPPRASPSAEGKSPSQTHDSIPLRPTQTTVSSTSRPVAFGRIFVSVVIILIGIGLLSFSNEAPEAHKQRRKSILLTIWDKISTPDSRAPEPAAPSLPMNTFHVTSEGLAGLRRIHRVRALQNSENGQLLETVPAGVFGYVASQALPHLSKARILQTSTAGALEVHKLPGSLVMLAGYAREADTRTIVQGRPSRLLLSPIATGQYQTGFAVPVEWVRSLSARGTTGEVLLEFSPPSAPLQQ
jgi:nucleoside phosphorylase